MKMIGSRLGLRTDPSKTKKDEPQRRRLRPKNYRGEIQERQCTKNATHANRISKAESLKHKTKSYTTVAKGT